MQVDMNGMGWNGSPCFFQLKLQGEERKASGAAGTAQVSRRAAGRAPRARPRQPCRNAHAAPPAAANWLLNASQTQSSLGDPEEEKTGAQDGAGSALRRF